jgi:hypothetical protein
MFLPIDLYEYALKSSEHHAEMRRMPKRNLPDIQADLN